MISENLRGGLYMSVAMAAFLFNDTIVKLVSASMPVHEIIFLRGLFATIMLAALSYLIVKAINFKHFKEPIMWLRAFCEVAATYTFITGLQFIPIANAAAILAALPLVVTLGDALVFKSPVGWRRWSAILVGFVGVLIIVRPGLEGFSVYTLYIIACVGFAAVRDLITRSTPSEIPSPLLAVATSIAITASGGLVTSYFGVLTAISWATWGYLFIASLFLVCAYYFIIMAVRTGEVSFVSPFRYTALLWAFLFGFLVFGDPLDWYTLIGSTIIVATGIYTIYREQLRARQAEKNI